MPLYEYECAKGHRTEAFAGIADREHPVKCDICGGLSRFVVSAAAVVGLEEERGYYDEGLGEYVRSRAHADEIGRRHGLVRRESRVKGSSKARTPNPVSPLVRIGKPKEEGFNAY